MGGTGDASCTPALATAFKLGVDLAAFAFSKNLTERTDFELFGACAFNFEASATGFCLLTGIN
jgi:hypothetical protein